jgi:uncharacterized spore protein YtfJ
MTSRWLCCIFGLALACNGEAEGEQPGSAGSSSADAGGGGGSGGSASIDAGPALPVAPMLIDEIRPEPVDKIDLLLMIDNSKSMSDKQEILRSAVPDLVRRLVNPICVDAQGNQPGAARGQCELSRRADARVQPDRRHQHRHRVLQPG